jgi:hypothetical protein
MAKHMSSDGSRPSSKAAASPRRDAARRSRARGADAGASGPQGYVSLADPAARRDRKAAEKRGGFRPRHLLFVILALVVVVAGVNGALLWRDVNAIKADAASLAAEASDMGTALKEGDADELTSSAAEFGKLASKMDATVQAPWWVAAQFIPVYGQDVAQARVLLGTLDDVSGDVVEPAAQALAGVKVGDLFSDGTVDIGVLRQVTTVLEDVKEPLQDAMDTVNATQPFHIEKLESAMAQVRDKASLADTLLDESDQVLPYLPAMLGADGDTQTYLLVAMNNVETRSLGGFSGSMGLMTVTDGKLEMGEFSSMSDNVDEGMSEATDEEKDVFTESYQNTPGTVMFNPDFPRAAERLREMYAVKTGTEVDGVVAVDTVFLQSLIKLTGSIETSWGVELTGDNAAEIIMNTAYKTYGAVETDAFFADVASEAFDHIFANLGDADLFQLAETFSDAFEQGNFYAWCEDAGAEGAIEALGADGALSTDEAKPVLGVYTNDFTWSKIDWYLDVKTTVGEGVKNADGSTTYRCTTTLTNHLTEAEAAELPRYIWGYNTVKRSQSDIITNVLLFAPAGGTVYNVEGSGSSFYSHEKSVYGFDVEFCMAQDEAGETTTITYDVTTSTAATSKLTVRETSQAREFTD